MQKNEKFVCSTQTYTNDIGHKHGFNIVCCRRIEQCNASRFQRSRGIFKCPATLIPNVIGNVEQFNGLFGPSNPLEVMKYSLRSAAQSKYEFIDIAYRYNNHCNILIGPIEFFGLGSSNGKIKTTEEMKQALESGNTKLMAYISHFDGLQDRESASLLTAIAGNLFEKMNDLISNGNQLAKITERYPKFDETSYDRSKAEIFKKYTSGQFKSETSSETVRLEITVTPCKPNNKYSCYEMLKKISRAKDHMHFYPPLYRSGYFLLKMPYIRATIRQTTDFSIKLHANYMFADCSETIYLPLCFDMTTGLEINDEAVVGRIEDIVGDGVTDEDSMMEECQPYVNPLEVLSSSMTVDEILNYGEVDLPFTQMKQLSTSMLDCMKRHEDCEQSLKLDFLENFVNSCIRYLKKMKVLLRNKNGGTVINSRIPEYHAPSGCSLKALTSNLKSIYDKYRLTSDIDSAFDLLWNEAISSTSNSKRSRERSVTPAIAPAEPKHKAAKFRK
uniref:IVSP2-1-like protein n=1 Tax=Glypta fumiferanae TaxID=389681 RepID=A0A0F6Q8R9_9HYME|nr:IVSP2-1-like protein [Glypta fumiferanae]